MDTFWLGLHQTEWLEQTDVPIFVSRRRLTRRKRMPKPIGPWALDSGGFTELSLFGKWVTTPEEYVADVQRFVDGMGMPTFAAPQDWMVEPWMLKKTELTVDEHQRRTIDNYLDLKHRAPELPWIPVLQGWEIEEYLKHVAMYETAGVDLKREPLVGVGSVCRRQKMKEGARIVAKLAAQGLRLHGFGFKVTGLMVAAHWLTSADSMSWSFRARRGQIRLPGCTHRTCGNCLKWALVWREKILKVIQTPKQDTLFP